MRKYIFTYVLLLTSVVSYSQDPEFSQYYSAPLYLNPAFSGTANGHRLISNYRNQWPGVGKGFVTYAFSYDYNLQQYNSGLGLLVIVDKAGTAGLKSTQFNFQYSYKVHLGSNWVFSSGLNFGLVNRSTDFNSLIFGDELNFDSNTPGTSPDRRNLDNVTYFDFGAGGLLYNRTIWFGFSTAHLNEPNRSMLNDESIVPIKTTVHGGVRIPLYRGLKRKEHSAAIAPSFVYKRQGNFDQLDMGMYFLYEPIVLGLWYRGIPIQQSIGDNINHDAAVVIVGFQLEKIELSYSYDVTVSQLGTASGGAHEIAIKYRLGSAGNIKTKKRERFIPCPTFYKDM